MFNLKNKEWQKKFKALTSKPSVLSSIFEKETNVNKATNKFFKQIFKIIPQWFKKKRVKPKVDKNLEYLFHRKRDLKNRDDVVSKEELAKVEKDISEHPIREKNNDKIKKDVQGWKLMNEVSIQVNFGGF